MRNNLIIKIKVIILALYFVFCSSFVYAAKNEPNEEIKYRSSSGDTDDELDEDEINDCREIDDKFMKMNRIFYKFNDSIDSKVLVKLAKAYEKSTGDQLKKTIQNISQNYSTPVSTINSAIQLNFKDTAINFWRFVINTTLGGLGANDVASGLGLPKPIPQNFGSTLARYGVGPGKYIVLPFLGPTCGRDLIGLIFVDSWVNPIGFILSPAAQNIIKVSNVIHTRYLLLPVSEGVLKQSLDPYSLVKNAYFQSRESQLFYPKWYNRCNNPK